MTTMDRVQFATFEREPRPIIELPAIAPSYYELVTPVRSAIVCARRHLLSRQSDDGRWVGHQISDASLPSQLVLLLVYLGQQDSDLIDQAVNAILRDQLANGGWAAAPGRDADLSISVHAYFALKLAGQKANRPYMAAARQLIRELGGADRADATTRSLLALFGQIDGKHCGSKSIELSRGVRELFVKHPAEWATIEDDPKPTGSRFLELFWQIVADDARWEEKLRPFILVDEDRDEARPCLGLSPELDAAIAREALVESGIRAEHFRAIPPRALSDIGDIDTTELAALARLCSACDSNCHTDSALPPEIRVLGDRCSTMSTAKHDDSVSADSLRKAIAENLLSRQNIDGSWSVLGPPDVVSDSASTAIVIEALARCDEELAVEAVRRGVTFLREAQRADGSWDSESGVRFVHGTSRAVCALMTAGALADDPTVEAGVNWLVVHQQESGGWGEAAPPKDEHNEMVPAAASAIQTAWAVSALVATGRAMDNAALLGIQFLVETQEEDGDWHDVQFTLRDPLTEKWYRNDLFSAAESLSALARWAIAAASEQATAEPVGLRLCSS
jgi:prenyltransferase beta subunit